MYAGLCVPGFALAVLDVAPRPLWIVVGLWTGLAYLNVAVIYALDRPRLFGKRSDGRLSPRLALATLPYLLLVWGFHRLKRFRDDWALAPWTAVGADLWIGRLGPHEPPPDAERIVDLTCEFPVPRRWRRRSGYRSLPTLNRWIPEAGAVRRLLGEIGSAPVAVACGAGKGRSALLAVVLMVERGLAPNVREAETRLAALRAGVRLHPVQRRLAEQLAPPRAAGSPASSGGSPSRP